MTCSSQPLLRRNSRLVCTAPCGSVDGGVAVQVRLALAVLRVLLVERLFELALHVSDAAACGLSSVLMAPQPRHPFTAAATLGARADAGPRAEPALVGSEGLPSGIRSIHIELTEQAGRKLVPCGGLLVAHARRVAFYWWPAQATCATDCARADNLPVPAPSNTLARHTGARV